MNFIVLNQKGEIHEVCGYRKISEFPFKTMPFVHFVLKVCKIAFVVALTVPNAKGIINEISVKNEIITTIDLHFSLCVEK